MTKLPKDIPAILIVDDIPGNITALEAIVGDLDCIIYSAGSGEEALRMLLRQEFAVMILDVQMPSMDGFDVARHARMRSATRDMPIMFLTAALDSDEDQRTGYGAGAVDYLVKPVNREVLVSKVRVFLELFVSRRRLKEANAQLAAKNAQLLALAEAEATTADCLRRAHDELRVAYERLGVAFTQSLQGAKLAATGSLLAGAAASIDVSLCSAYERIEGLQDLELRNGEVEPAWLMTQAALADVATDLERTRVIVRALLCFSSLGDGEKKPFSVRESVSRLVTLLAHRTGQRVELQTELGEPDLVTWSSVSFNQLLLNLVASALDAIDEQGSVSIRTEHRAYELVLQVEHAGDGQASGSRGSGAAPAVSKGTSVGISIASTIVKEHQGSMDIRQTPAGTAVIVRIPLNQAGEQRPVHCAPA